jgi:hypothetical protein
MSGFLKNILSTTLVIPLLISCSTDFSPNVGAPSIPVAYGVICPLDSRYFVRLTKTFIGPGSAYDYASIPDSIYYDGASVWLETRDLDGKLVERAPMHEEVIADRLPGIFSTSPNRIFVADTSDIHLREDFFTSLGRPYHLNLNLVAVVPGYPDTIRATTRLRSVPHLTEPRYTFINVYFYTDDPFMMEWMDTNDEGYFQILVRMHYTDYYYDDEKEMTAEWVLSGISVNMTSLPGGQRKVYSYYFRPENFYAQVARVIPVDREVEARVCRNLDFIVLSSNREMEYYRSVYEIADDYHGGGYTNVENGYGLFTTYITTGVYGLTLGPDELDSLANGSYTRRLNFKHYGSSLKNQNPLTEKLIRE